MVQSDTLSRLQHLNREVNDNDNIVLLPDKMFISLMDVDLANRIRTSNATDKVVLDALAAAKSGNVLPMKSTLADWIFEDGLVFYQKRCYVPADENLHRDIVRRYHDPQPMGHPGQFATLELVRRDYWWPGMASFVRNYVLGCAMCQQAKINTHPTVPPLMPIPAKKGA